MGAKHSVPVTSTQGEVSSTEADEQRNALASETSTGLHVPDIDMMARPRSSIVGLDEKVRSTLVELKKERDCDGKEGQHNPFTRIILKFPIVARAFNSVRSTFEQLDKDMRGYIVYADMEGAFDMLGVTFSKEEIRQVFHESDITENGRLSFKEFLVCLAIGFVLHRIPSLEGERLSIFYAPLDKKGKVSTGPSMLFGEGNKLRIAFQLAVDAFLWFDMDGDGVINRSEMAMRLGPSMHAQSPTKRTMDHAHSGHRAVDSAASVNSFISERRFNEMDWNHDGTIQFKEFLLAFESWVGLDDDDIMDTSEVVGQ